MGFSRSLDSNDAIRIRRGESFLRLEHKCQLATGLLSTHSGHSLLQQLERATAIVSIAVLIYDRGRN